ncbi:MAG: HAD family hydrolase [Verrucomicrobiota bacterium]
MKAIFLDRDDTLIRNVPYLGDPSRVELCPGAAEAVHAWQAAGWLLVMVSNQSGVGRGLITKEQVASVNRETYRQLRVKGFDAEYFCYAAPGDPYGSEERKPSPIMLQRAAQEMAIDLAASYMIGDKEIDVECGHRAGCRSVLVLTGNAGEGQRRARERADFTAEHLGVAAEWVLQQPVAQE